MKAPPRQEFRRSQLLYRCLLLAYPRAHRAEYGAAMTQLFRDQCRDAWTESRRWGLLKLWLRMTDKLANLFAFRAPPLTAFFRVFIPVFLLVVIASVAITFILPEIYASTARIKVEADTSPANSSGTSMGCLEALQSQAVLAPVLDKLNLNVQWGKKWFNGQTLKPEQTLAILRPRIQLHPIRNTRLTEITAYSDDPKEAAAIANAIAESYRNWKQNAQAPSAKLEAQNTPLLPQPVLVQIIDRAEPGHAPVKPNKPLNLVLGTLGGILLASAAGAVFAGLAYVIGRHRKAAI